jgi:hypothetical protein
VGLLSGRGVIDNKVTRLQVLGSRMPGLDKHRPNRLCHRIVSALARAKIMGPPHFHFIRYEGRRPKERALRQKLDCISSCINQARGPPPVHHVGQRRFSS